MQADLEDLHPSLRELMEQDEEYMKTQKTEDNERPVATPPAGFYDDEISE